jgi:hypothetical protein
VKDERVKLVQKLGGGLAIRIDRRHLDALGVEGFANGIMAHGFTPSDCGAPRRTGRWIESPILRMAESE